MRRFIFILCVCFCELFIPVQLKVFSDPAASDLWDYNIKQGLCMLGIPEVAKNLNYCDHEDDLLTCLRMAAEEANVEDRNEVKAVYQTFVDMCTPGTESNKLYMANRVCVKGALTDQWRVAECSAQMINEVSKLSQVQLREPTLTRRLTCDHADSLSSCLADIVKDRCGDEGIKFNSAMQGSTQRLLTQACIESGNGSGIAAANVYSIFQVMTAFAMIKWFSFQGKIIL